MREDFLIGVVGPCKAGKSTLIAGLQQLGYQARQIAQEHSFVPDMWQRLTKPDVLIYLDVSYHNTIERSNIHWTPADHHAQQARLEHARQHADLYIDTDDLTAEEVFVQVRRYLAEIAP